MSFARRRLSPILLLPLLLALPACEDSPTGLEGAAADVDLAALGWDHASGGPGAHGPDPMLHALLRRALSQVGEAQGREAARALLEPVRAHIEAARAAREAGDRDGAMAALRAARLESARIIVDVLGTSVVDEALTRARQSVDRVAERLERARAGGRDVTRLEERLTRLREALAEAEAAYQAGDFPLALERATRVAGFGMRPGGRHGTGHPGARRP